MKKNLTIILAVLAIVAMAIPASAATLTWAGDYSAAWMYDEEWSATNKGTLSLKLTFKEGDKITAYLPLTIKPFNDKLVAAGTKWYFSYATAPWSFWVSDNNKDNAKKFASLGDPLGIAANRAGTLAVNAQGEILGAKLNLYFIDNATNAFMGRMTYGLPFGFDLGLIGVFTDGADNTGALTFGADIAGKIPEFGAKLTLAGAGTWSKVDNWEFEAQDNNLAYMLSLTDINVGPVAAWAKYTAVGENLSAPYKSTASTAILNKYAGKAAAEVEATVDIPVGIPAKLTLGNGLWMAYPATMEYDEVTAKVVVEPIKDLTATVSGAYKFDLNADDDADEGKDYTGWKVHGDVAYAVAGIELNPYVDYLKNSYTETPDSDFIVGMGVSGSPLAGLDLEADANYTIEEKAIDASAYAKYATEANPGFVKSAMTTVAGAVGFNKVGADDATTYFYGFAGSELGITDKLNAKVRFLNADKAYTIAGNPEAEPPVEDVVIASGIVANAGLTYKASDSITVGLDYTYRQYPVAAPAASKWIPFADEGKSFLQAKVDGAVGKSTITLAYGVNGLTDGDSTGFHAEKPWNNLVNKPTAAMNWELITISVKVPF